MKKILIISYYWPPSGGSGVQRWLKFAKYLPENNWKPIIYTPENPYFDVYDKSLLDDIPKEVEVLKNKIWEPYFLKDKLFGKSHNSQTSGVISDKNSFKNMFFNWIRGNIFIPDPKVYWVSKSIKYLWKYIQSNNIQHIISTGPPHSMHLIGLGLKKKNKKLKWIADFRDPWSELDLLDDFHLSNFARKRNKNLEQQVLNNSDLVLTVSRTWASDLNRLGANSVKVITNGYDNFDFPEIKSANNHKKFVIGHYGLLNHLRNPSKLWEVLNDLSKEYVDFSNDLEIHLSGNVDKEILEKIKSYSFLKNKIKLLGYLDHSEVIKAYYNSSILLVLLFNSVSGRGNHPAKLFECIASKKPIFVFGPEYSDTKILVESDNFADYFIYGTNELDIKNKIKDLYFNKNNFRNTNTTDFSREKLTSDLAEILNNI